MDRNVRIARELIKLAKDLSASIDEGGSQYRSRWRDDIEWGNIGMYRGSSTVNIYVHLDTLLPTQETREVPPEAIRAIPLHMEELSSAYGAISAVMKKLVDAIDSAKYVTYGNYDSDKSYYSGEWLSISLVPTDETYRVACEEFDRVARQHGLDPYDYEAMAHSDEWEDVYEEAAKAGEAAANEAFAHEVRVLEDIAEQLK